MNNAAPLPEAQLQQKRTTSLILSYGNLVACSEELNGCVMPIQPKLQLVRNMAMQMANMFMEGKDIDMSEVVEKFHEASALKPASAEQDLVSYFKEMQLNAKVAMLAGAIDSSLQRMSSQLNQITPDQRNNFLSLYGDSCEEMKALNDPTLYDDPQPAAPTSDRDTRDTPDRVFIQELTDEQLPPGGNLAAAEASSSCHDADATLADESPAAVSCNQV